MPLPEPIGTRIRRLRNVQDPLLTQEVLALRMQLRGHGSITQQRIQEIEIGKRVVRPEELVDLARIFGIPITELLGVPDYDRD